MTVDLEWYFQLCSDKVESRQIRRRQRRMIDKLSDSELEEL